MSSCSQNESKKKNNTFLPHNNKPDQSRDYSCRCGKSYLSYSAVYTHIKNKHQGDKSMYIGNPDHEEQKRGRPKRVNQMPISIQNAKLSVIEETILKIYENFEKNNGSNRYKPPEQKVLLQGNQEQRIDELIREYDKLVQKMNFPILDIFFDRQKYGQNGKLIGQFMEGLSKHFNVHISIKIIWLVNFFMTQYSNLNIFKREKQVKSQETQLVIDHQKIKQQINNEKLKNLWKDTQIIQAIRSALQRWLILAWKVNQSQ